MAVDVLRDETAAVRLEAASAAAAQPLAAEKAARGSWALQLLGLIFFCGAYIVRFPFVAARAWRSEVFTLLAQRVAHRAAGHVIVLTLGAAALWAAPLAAGEAAARVYSDVPGYYTSATVYARAAETIFPDVMVRPPLLETTVVLRPRDEILAYQVRGNDTLVDIAERNGITLDTLLWANDIAADYLLLLGDTLRVPPIDGVIYTVADGDVLHEIAEAYRSNPVDIAEYNRIGLSTTLVPGMELIIPYGVLPEALRKTPSAQGALSEREQPVAAFGEFIWPADGAITQYYHGHHPGLDIGNRVGTAIVAADAGQVIGSGWDALGYGYRVVINHGNGWVTTYNHLHDIYVSVGDYVKSGETIATMGNTGYSTGPHLHFEVLYNNRFRNPLTVLD